MSGGGSLWGVLILVAVPYLILATIGGGLVRARRRAARREVEELLRSLEAPSSGAEREGRAA